MIRVYVRGKKAPFEFPAGDSVSHESQYLYVWSNRPSERNPWKSTSTKAGHVLAMIPAQVVLAVLLDEGAAGNEDPPRG